MSSDDAASQEYHLLLASSRREPPVETNFTTKTVFCGLLAIAFISISYAFIEAPLYRLYEVALCKGYYREHNPSVVEPGGQIPEEKCKVVSIQQDLAILLTTQAQIDFCTSLLASIHTRGFGRRSFLKLNISCLLFSKVFICSCLWYGNLPIELTWLSSAFILLACGPEMRQETIFMVVADATQKDERFTVFILGQIIVLPPAILAKRFAAYLMTQNLWAPMALGLTSTLITLMIIWRMPIDVHRTTAVDAPQTDGQEAQADDGNTTEGRSLLQTIIHQNKKNFQVFFLSRSISLLGVTFLVTSTFGQLMAGTVFLQYVEKQLGFDMAEASKVQSNSDLMNMISLVITFLVCGNPNSAVFGPFRLWLGDFFLKYVNRGRLLSIKEINISRFCAVMMTLGFVVIGIAHSYSFVIAGLLICAAGQAYRMSTRASLTAMAKDHSEDNTTGLYTIIYYFDIIGGTLINAMLAASFSVGLQWKGAWIGLPFFCAAITWFMVGIITFSVKTSPRNEEQTSNNQ